MLCWRVDFREMLREAAVGDEMGEEVGKKRMRLRLMTS